MNNYKPSQPRFYPWFVISLAACFLFYKYVLQVSPSIMTEALMQHFKVQGFGLGNLAASFFYSYFIVQLFVGPLLDKYNPRFLTAAAIAISGFGAIIFASSDSLLLASLGRALIGVGAAFATVNYLKMTAVWFPPHQFAFVGGLLATAAMTGSLIGQTPLAYTVAHIGWQTTLYACGVFGVIFAGFYALTIKNPEQANITASARLRFADFAEVLTRRHNWYLMLYSGLAFSPVAVFGGLWGNPFLQENYHINTTQAATLCSFVFLGLAIGGPVWGKLADYSGKRYMIMMWGLILSLLGVTLAIYDSYLSTTTLAIALFVFGFGTGAFMLGFAVGTEMNKVVLAATVIGLINSGDALFGAFSEPLVGKILDVFWQGKLHGKVHVFSLQDYHIAFILLPCYLILAMGLLRLLRRHIMAGLNNR